MISPLLRPTLGAACALALAASAFGQSAPSLKFPPASPPATLKQQVGITDIEISYSRPSMKGREIFGGLVPYDQVWRTGANNAPKITFSTEVKLNGVAVPAGTYELFTIPSRDEWTVIVHKNMSQWGTYAYDPANDIVRFKVKPAATERPVETFAIGFNDLRDESATLYLAWEKTRVPIQVAVDVKAVLVPQIEAAMSNEGQKPYFQAAMFYFDHKIDLNKAGEWMDAAIAQRSDMFWAHYHRARLHVATGNKDAARASAQKSIEIAKKAGGAVAEEYVRLNEALLASLN
jgi:hypothetical protein